MTQIFIMYVYFFLANIHTWVSSSHLPFIITQKGVYVFLSLYLLGGGFKYYYFHPYLGTWSNLTDIFQMGLKPPTSIHITHRMHKWPGSAFFLGQVDAHHAEKSNVFDPQHDTPLVDATRFQMTHGQSVGLVYVPTLTWPMAKLLKLFGKNIFSRETEVQSVISRFHLYKWATFGWYLL